MLIESFFDRAKLGTGLRGPRLLYHYTSWEAAENILRSQRLWATAHNCTNDEAELRTADAIILDAVREAEAKSGGIARRVLRLFLETYEFTSIGSTPRTYLVCFSQTRDDAHQWTQYSREGSGVCLGLRLFQIPSPEVRDITTSFMSVTYEESAVREKVDVWLREFVRILDRAEDIEHNWRLAMNTLNVTAAAWSLTAKQARWEPENEVRAIFLVREGARVLPLERVRPDGTTHRYIEVPVTRLRRMPVEEFIIGPNQDSANGLKRAIGLLADVGYPKPESRVVVSSAILSGQTVAPL